MRLDAVMPFARFLDRIDVHNDQGEIRKRVQQPMTQFGCNRVRLRDCQMRIDSDIDLGVKTVT